MLRSFNILINDHIELIKQGKWSDLRKHTCKKDQFTLM